MDHILINNLENAICSCVLVQSQGHMGHLEWKLPADILLKHLMGWNTTSFVLARSIPKELISVMI